MDIVKSIYAEAQKFNPCRLFSGDESFESMMRLFLTSQGIEFCIAHDFPCIETILALKLHHVEKMGIWIDAGKKTLRNEKIAVLVGDTEFNLEYNTLEYPCRVVLMKGAKAHIKAEGYSVVAIASQYGCIYDVERSGHAVVR